MKPGDRVEHTADHAHGTVIEFDFYLPEIEGVRVLWDGETESTVHPTANIKPLPDVRG